MLVSLPWLWWSQEASREEESIQRGQLYVGPKRVVSVAESYLTLDSLQPEGWWFSLPPVFSHCLWDNCRLPSHKLHYLRRFFCLYGNTLLPENSPQILAVVTETWRISKGRAFLQAVVLFCQPYGVLYSWLFIIFIHQIKTKTKSPATSEVHAFRLPYASAQRPCGQYP